MDEKLEDSAEGNKYCTNVEDPNTEIQHFDHVIQPFSLNESELKIQHRGYSAKSRECFTSTVLPFKTGIKENSVDSLKLYHVSSKENFTPPEVKYNSDDLSDVVPFQPSNQLTNLTDQFSPCSSHLIQNDRYFTIFRPWEESKRISVEPSYTSQNCPYLELDKGYHPFVHIPSPNWHSVCNSELASQDKRSYEQDKKNMTVESFSSANTRLNSCSFDSDDRKKTVHLNGTGVSKTISNYSISATKKSYVCDICRKAFTQNDHLKTHLRTHTGEKPFVCINCNKGFTKNSNLTHHLRIHTSQMPYVCDICGKAFTRKDHLTRHLRIHTGEKPFVCKNCNKGFAVKSNLTRHLCIHTRQNSYVCTICGMVFTQRVHLTNHLPVHTSQKP